MSVLVNVIEFCDESQRAGVANRIRATYELPPGSLDACPYVFIGEAQRMRAALAECKGRFDLGALLISSTTPRETVERFFDQVLARA